MWACTGPITYDPTALRQDVMRLEAAVEERGRHRRLPARRRARERRTGCATSTTPTEEEFVYAVADALHEEYKGIVDAGLLLQVDDAVLLHEFDSILSLGGTTEDYRRWAQLRVDALNHALTGIPEDRVRYHVCCGSFTYRTRSTCRSRTSSTSCSRSNARYYLIEMANARHEHEWRLWEDVALPEGKVLIPGVVTHHTNVVEHPELVAERLVRLAKLVGRESVMGGTDCGFAQGAFVQRVHPTIQWAKLEALAAGARIATKRLFPERADA